MTELNLPLPSLGQPNSTEDPDILACFQAIQALLNGGLDATNFTGGAGLTSSMLSSALATYLGVQAGARAQSGVNPSSPASEAIDSTPRGVGQAAVVTQPNPGLTLVFWTAEVQRTSGANAGTVGLFAGGVPTNFVDTVSFTNGTFAYLGGLGSAAMRMVAYNLPGSTSWQVGGSVSGGAGFIRNPAVRALALGF